MDSWIFGRPGGMVGDMNAMTWLAPERSNHGRFNANKEPAAWPARRPGWRNARLLRVFLDLARGLLRPDAAGRFGGLGGGLLARDKSVLRAALCGLIALGLGLFTEWRCEPFIADQSLGYFATHLHQLRPITLLMVAAGGALGCWLSLGKERPETPSAKSEAPNS